MRLPEVTDWVKDTPVRALRTVFAGIGQLLLAVDRDRDQEPDSDQGQSAAEEHHDPLRGQARQRPDQDIAPKPAKQAKPAKPSKAAKPAKQTKPAKEVKGASGTALPGSLNEAGQAGEQPRWRSLDATGNVRLLTPDDAAEKGHKPPAAQKTQRTQKPPAAQKTQKAAKPPAAQKPPPVSPASLPLPRYDDLSLPSLRARLRNLDADQLRVLIDYEKSNAGREDVVTMFERRIARLGSET